MPAHISHMLFAEEAVRRLGADGEQMLAVTGNAVRLGAQGPDLFYHSLRTHPRGFRFGPLMHRARYGSLIRFFLHHARPDAETTAFAAGLATHAALDRCWHPYIVYRSGWAVPGKPETRHLARCHVFLERILDVLIAEKLRGDMRLMDFFSDIHLGEELPTGIRDALVSAIAQVYPRAHDSATAIDRVANAYRDALRFYAMTDVRHPSFRRRAQELEQREGTSRRRLAIFHPLTIDRSIDWTNESHHLWCHPCDADDTSTDSVFDLFEQALREVDPMLRAILRFAQYGSGGAKVAYLVGDHGLNLTRADAPCTPLISDPLPVTDLLDAQYEPHGGVV